MNIVVLNGSPRLKGNTSAVITSMLSGIDKASHEIEVINTAKLTIAGCTACNHCKNGDHKCIHKDDTNETIGKLIKADILVFATPVYWWGMSAQLKLVVDKFYANQPQLKNKKYGLITIGGAGLGNIQYDLINKQFQSIASFLAWTNLFEESESAYELNDLREDKIIMDKYKAIGKSL